MKLSGAELLIKLLEIEDVKYISGIPGGFNLPIYNALYESDISHILARSEQGAAFIAQGISRTSNSVGVCFATSGPGATNLLTAIADAKLDSIPLIAITGQVPSTAIGTDAFQEVDAFGLFLPVCKHNYLVKDAMELLEIIPKAFYLAKEGRPGPVLIDIPKDVQNQTVDVDLILLQNKYKNSIYEINLSTIKKISKTINNSFKPIIYAGGGIINSNASKELKDFAHKNNIPVALTLMGLGSLPYNDTLNLGMLGMHGAPYTNYLINEADLIIAIGVRFDDRATGNINNFCPNATIIHIDIDASEINKLKPSNLSLICDAKEFLKEIMPYIDNDNREEWIKHVNVIRDAFPLPYYEDELHPSNFIQYISKLVPEDTIIATDVGEHQMWTAQRYNFIKPKTLITSGGLGTMGFGLPAAIGAALENQDKTVICFTGDGSILMNIQEFATLADYKLNIKIIIFNNKHLGLVRQQQELFYDKHYIASKFITNPDFMQIAEGFGIKSCNLETEKEPLEKLKEIFRTDEPYVINLPVSETEKILPMVAPGAANVDMIGVRRN